MPLCIKYDMDKGEITQANIYFETDMLKMQRQG
jgi:hypothetical protein